MLTLWTFFEPELHSRLVEIPLMMMRPKVTVRTREPSGELLVPEEGEIILGMGGYAAKTVQQAGLAPKGRSLNSLREKVHVHPDTGGGYMFTYSPDYTYVDAAAGGIITWDLRLAHRQVTTGTLEPQVGKYEYTRTLKYVRQYIEEEYERTGKPVDTAIDLETMGFFPWYKAKKIVSLSVSPAEGYSDVVYMLDKWSDDEWATLMEEVEWLLTSPMIALRGANLKFDLIWMRVKWGIQCTNFKGDTLLLGSLVDENRSNSLNNHAKIYTSMGGYDIAFNNAHDKAHMEKVSKEDLLLYAGGDSDACLRSFGRIRDEVVSDARLTKLYVDVVHPAARAFETIERRGLYVDKDRYEDLGDRLRSDRARLHKRLVRMVPKKLRKPYEENTDADKYVMDKDNLIREFLFTDKGLNLEPKVVTEKKQEPSTAKTHLDMFLGHPDAGPFVTKYAEFKAVGKALGTYVDGFLEHLRPDGLFHPTYMLFRGSMYEGKDDDSGARTGRSAAKNPAIQTLPEYTALAPDLKRCFPAPPGWTYFRVDYDQGELKITACWGPEPTMLDAYLNDMDLHAITGAKFAGVPFDEFLSWAQSDPATFKKWRQIAKSANFGLLYGMMAAGYQRYTHAKGMDITMAQAEDAVRAFFDLYPGLKAWHNKEINFVHNNGVSVSPLGRVRHLPLINSNEWSIKAKAERQAINFPIQSTLTDMCMWAIGVLDREYGLEGDLWLAGMTHDSIYGYVPKGSEHVWLPRVAEVMENLPLHTLGWKPELKFTASAEMGPNMADVEKVALTA